MLTDYRIKPAHGAKPKQVVIFLHGLGDSGSGGLLTIGQMWQQELPECEFLCPDAPFPHDMMPEEFGGRQWFSLRSFAPNDVARGVREAAPILDQYIDHVLETRGIASERLALVGFSQGTMMALHVALRRSAPLACIVGYSGMMADTGSLAAEKKSAPPILLVHGMQDDVVPFVAMSVSEQALKSAQIPVQTLACPGLAHSIDDAGLKAGMQFLKQHFS
jgi:phospholipase/carboxylesterase